MALVEAAKILRKHLNPFVGYTSRARRWRCPLPPIVFALEAPLESRLGMLVSDLRLSVRAAQLPARGGHPTVRELVIGAARKLLEVRNFGETTLQEIEEKLSEIGLRLGMDGSACRRDLIRSGRLGGGHSCTRN